MAKATLEFDLDDPDDALAHKRAINADKVYIALHDIVNKLFRPARKHGYGDGQFVQRCINKAIDAGLEINDFELEDFQNDVVTSAIGKLESDFYELLEEYDINMEDLR